MDDLIEQIAALEERGERGALASLIWSSGSIPMSERAKMLVREDGQMLGTIGGGCLEAEILAIGRQVIQARQPQLTRYTMTEKQAGESGLNCGGTVRIFTEPVGPHAELYTQVARARRERRPCALVTLIAGARTARLLVFADGQRQGTLGAEAVDQWAADCAAKRIAGDQSETAVLELEPALASSIGSAAAEVFIEPHLPPPVLYIFGGGHVGGQICRLAAQVGFRVVVVDDRPYFANSRRHPEAAQCAVGELDQVFATLPIDEQSFIVAATRGHQHDEVVIERAIRTPARYIGMLGSERKKLLMWKRLEARGGSRQRLDQIYAPVGLNIGADTPEEIAVSVVAELIKVRRGATKQWKTKRLEPAA